MTTMTSSAKEARRPIFNSFSAPPAATTTTAAATTAATAATAATATPSFFIENFIYEFLL